MWLPPACHVMSLPAATMQPCMFGPAPRDHCVPACGSALTAAACCPVGSLVPRGCSQRRLHPLRPGFLPPAPWPALPLQLPAAALAFAPPQPPPACPGLLRCSLQLPAAEFAYSMGLPTAPKLRFLKKAGVCCACCACCVPPCIGGRRMPRPAGLTGQGRLWLTHACAWLPGASMSAGASAGPAACCCCAAQAPANWWSAPPCSPCRQEDARGGGGQRCRRRRRSSREAAAAAAAWQSGNWKRRQS